MSKSFYKNYVYIKAEKEELNRYDENEIKFDTKNIFICTQISTH